ncbi:MAG: GTPase ObgE [Bacteroidota bacterium]|nr:GTPase ObgE [Bacteroidota bacterium]
MFIDSVIIRVRSGNGGSGCVGFRREKFIPKGGPDGGDGGRGGDVIIRADARLHTLLDFRYRKEYVAGHGSPGSGARKTGKAGRSCIVRVPCGTVVSDAATGEILADLVADAQEVIVAKGGRGGRGNAALATPTRQAPRYAEPGSPGEERELALELKLIADIGLVGLPNAGKSTLISVVSAARPKIADYPFTTTEPVLGIVQYKDHRRLTLADIPGLIEGAHRGKGLGHRFLKHIERTRALAILIDCRSESYEKTLETLMNELRMYSGELAKKPMLVAVSKIDLADPRVRSRIRGFEKKTGNRVLCFSSVTGEGVQELLEALWTLVKGLDTVVCAGV